MKGNSPHKSVDGVKSLIGEMNHVLVLILLQLLQRLLDLICAYSASHRMSTICIFQKVGSITRLQHVPFFESRSDFLQRLCHVEANIRYRIIG